MAINYLQVERALSGILSPDHLNSEEKRFYQNYKPVFEVGRLANRMAQGYYAHSAAMMAAKDPRSDELIRHPSESKKVRIPVEALVPRKDGSMHLYDVLHYLDSARANPLVVAELPRVWLVGSLLAVADALSEHHYFDHAPVLELIYHLRNGIAHGNRFHFNQAGRGRLGRYRADNTSARIRSQKQTEFRITEALHGQTVLFDFMGPGDVLDLLQSVEVYLTRIRERHAAGELSRLLKAVTGHP